MNRQTEPRVDELHIDRRIRRILIFEIVFVVTLYVVLFVGSNIFLSQQNKSNTQMQSRFKMMLNIQNLERSVIINGNLVRTYHLTPDAKKFDQLVKNYTTFGELISSTRDQLKKISPNEASRRTEELKLVDNLFQNFVKSVSASNALIGKEVLSPVAAYKLTNGGITHEVPTIASDKTPEQLGQDLATLEEDALGLTANWRTLATQDIARLQRNLDSAQTVRTGILLIQACLVILGLIVMSYSYVLPSFEKILKQVIVQNEELLRSDALKTEFISIASHQLRTPLSVVKWSLALVLKPENSNVTAEQRTMLNQAKEGAETVIKLVGNLLNLSRIEQGRLAYHPAPSDLIPLIDRVVKEAQPMATAHQVTISAEYEAKQAILNADPLLLKEVIQNLVDNAIAYNKPKGTVKVIVREKPDCWLMEVADTGYGIMPEDVNNLFTKFYRGMNARSIRPDGSGLGLYFIQKIINLHKGRITLESEPNEGTVFSVALPKPTQAELDLSAKTPDIPGRITPEVVVPPTATATPATTPLPELKPMQG